MKKLLVTSAITLALAMAGGAAHAATFSLSPTNGSASIASPNYAENVSFDDTYTFTISSLKDLSASITATFVTTTNGGVKTFVLKDLTNNTTVGSTKFTNTVGNKSYTTFAIDASHLTAGNYALQITGKGSYGGSLILTSSVPEASTTAMMLGGLAFVGMMALRRRRNEKNESALPTGMAAA
ncbi:FxDxF family PEP-CTERM protein [Herbaspirillum sp. CAH-3]|uniref:FxDxF family PEP-CTERM protein n=1 Tax=Herbaspirillum sp. CAH-3 TaxID=2605746 RepID=UPI0012AC999D|nr:FxDxF family PEP-CTERM protein [Herbaspirillum sp. CAH-3]MRT27592.1 PEP-CTERM sorting domain-containing protein [Herbaspirillum sp. CAH-3]